MKYTLLILLAVMAMKAKGQKIDSLDFSIGVAPGMSTTPVHSVEIRDGAGNTVAYKKKDSSWVFINHDKTRIVLDSLYGNRISKPKYEVVQLESQHAVTLWLNENNPSEITSITTTGTLWWVFYKK